MGNGFVTVRECLEHEKETDLNNRFAIFVQAVNVLKHGRGRSHDALIAMDNLPFRIKRPGDDFFSEGDISEVATLIEVDDQFVRDCAALIARVAAVINQVYPVGL